MNRLVFSARSLERLLPTRTIDGIVSVLPAGYGLVSAARRLVYFGVRRYSNALSASCHMDQTRLAGQGGLPRLNVVAEARLMHPVLIIAR